MNSSRTEAIKTITFDFPDTTTNRIIGGAGNIGTTDLDVLIGNIENSPYIEDFSPNILYFYKGTDLRNFGLKNSISTGSLIAGQRFYINRWDNNHSYIEITQVTYGSPYDTIGYKCCTEDGTIVLSQSMQVGGAEDGDKKYPCIPWCGYFGGWESANDAAFVMFQLGWRTNPSYLGMTCSWGHTAPTSLANARDYWSTTAPLDSNNPYVELPMAGPGGGNRDKTNVDDMSDVVTVDSMPNLSAVGSGLITVFSPTVQQVNRLAEVLWGHDFFDWVNKIGSNIDDLFICFGVVPFEVSKGSTVNVTYWGFLDLQSQIPMTLCDSQYEEFDMGTIDLANDSRIHTTDSVFDYSPFSKLSIYLPFIGIEELDIDECRGKRINLTYRIDVLSGSCVALITIDGVTLYQFSGNCMTQLPLTGVDASSMISNGVTLLTSFAAAGTASAIAGAGATAVEEAMTRTKAPISEAQGNLQNARYQAQVSSSRGNLASASANAAMGMKPNFKHSGAIGASTSLFAVKQPYLLLTTPNEAVPEYYERYCGLPSNITSRLGDLSGYTVVEDIRLNGLVATSPEVDEIYKLLKEGVII